MGVCVSLFLLVLFSARRLAFRHLVRENGTFPLLAQRDRFGSVLAAECRRKHHACDFTAGDANIDKCCSGFSPRDLFSLSLGVSTCSHHVDEGGKPLPFIKSDRSGPVYVSAVCAGVCTCSLGSPPRSSQITSSPSAPAPVLMM